MTSFKLYLLRLVTVISEAHITRAKKVYFFYNICDVLKNTWQH